MPVISEKAKEKAKAAATKSMTPFASGMKYSIPKTKPADALKLAQHNYTTQKEPRDAEVLMRAALASNQAREAQPALDWLRTSRFEDARLARLADALAAKGAKR